VLDIGEGMVREGWNTAGLCTQLSTMLQSSHFVLSHRDAPTLCAVLAIVLPEAREDHTQCARHAREVATGLEHSV
jgi:hypothetical protein